MTIQSPVTEEMTPLCKVEVTLPGVRGPRGCTVPVVSMSKKEFDRLEVLLGVQSGRLRVADACELLGLKRRQVFRLLAGLKHGGAPSLISKRRGRPSNNRLLRGSRTRVVAGARALR